ncbi:E3 UBIQUITIN-PROTEIN LIGASE RMA3 [Salix viminalis]|uniref:E3 UBIQUITIN-PROTEIN LIGASE RMA3 n=1 Tax=Salix viminalis TaxID=40686 RepID=A0A9Q0TAJ7_SALVM|nr:E3 UBIQUITIN-PROTEIN LIGASE RMA3 [Salix viminalis]
MSRAPPLPLTSTRNAQYAKADISHTTMVPLYGRGQGSDEAEGKTPYRGMIIPPRPSACGARGVMLNTSNTSQRLPYRNPYQSYNYNTNPYGSFDEAPPSPLLNLGDPMMQEPVVGVLREMIYARVFGAFPNTYHSMGTTNPRMRRHEMLADKSFLRDTALVLDDTTIALGSTRGTAIYLEGAMATTSTACSFAYRVLEMKDINNL